MTDNEHMDDELPEWDLDDWEPTAGETARALELWQQFTSDDPDFRALFRAFCDDVLSERNLPQMLLAILRHGRDSLIGAQGADLTVRRMAADVAVAREDIAREALWP